MNEMHCRLKFDDQNQNSNVIARKDSQYRLTPRGDLIEHTTYSIDRRKLIIIISAVIFSFVFTIGVCTVYAYSRNEEEYEESESSAAEESDITEEIVTEKPTIYDRCSSEYLSEEEAWAFYETEGPAQLQFIINLMFARHGYSFGPGVDDGLFFNKQEWYQKLEKREVPYEDLNPFEQKNTDLLVGILEAEGYR